VDVLVALSTLFFNVCFLIRGKPKKKKLARAYSVVGPAPKIELGEERTERFLGRGLVVM